jgi:hypothetical protein
VCPAKYRRVVFTEPIDQTLKEVCLEISKRYEIEFIEIGTDKDHVHFLIQSTPMNSPSMIIQTVKSITAKEIFRLHPEVKDQLWGGEFWTRRTNSGEASSGLKVTMSIQLGVMVMKIQSKPMFNRRARMMSTNNYTNNSLSCFNTS